jgi:probable F420-dependent oxidoreductase
VDGGIALMGVRIEVSLGLWQDRPPEEVIRTAALVDELGYPALWIGEMATWDAFVLAAHVGKAFQHSDLVLGPFAVAVRDPAMIAMGAASVAAVTGRQVAVALGTSSPVVVEQWHGRDRGGSARALAESAQACRLLLNGAKADVDGQRVRTRGYRLRLTPPHSELIVAAFGDQAIRVAAAHADRLVLNLVTPAAVGQLVGKLRDAAAEAGRPTPRVAVWTSCAIDPGPQAVEQLRRGVVGYLAAPGYGEMFAGSGYADLVAFARSRPHPSELLDRVPEELNHLVGLVGDQATVAARIQEYVRAGADDVVIVPSATDDDPMGEHTLKLAAEIAARQED